MILDWEIEWALILAANGVERERGILAGLSAEELDAVTAHYRFPSWVPVAEARYVGTIDVIDSTGRWPAREIGIVVGRGDGAVRVDLYRQTPADPNVTAAFHRGLNKARANAASARTVSGAALAEAAAGPGYEGGS